MRGKLSTAALLPLDLNMHVWMFYFIYQLKIEHIQQQQVFAFHKRCLCDSVLIELLIFPLRNKTKKNFNSLLAAHARNIKQSSNDSIGHHL